MYQGGRAHPGNADIAGYKKMGGHGLPADVEAALKAGKTPPASGFAKRCAAKAAQKAKSIPANDNKKGAV